MVDVTTKVKVDKPDRTLVTLRCGCDFIWSQAHEFAYLRLADKTGDNQYQFVNLFAARARRIAATYARFYLETEAGGDPAKRGRHYWMALGAFASKTVACLLDSFQVQGSYFVGKVMSVDLEDIAVGLGKGNLWLFMDIAASHWLYNHYPDHFAAGEGMACHEKRDSGELETGVRMALDQLPWSSEAQEKLNGFKPSKHIIEGFRLTKEIEQSLDDEQSLPNLQLQNLLAIAKHEQGEVLQPLLYDDPDFHYWTQFERHPLVRWAAPKYQIVFAHTCETDNDTLKSEAPDDMVVEDYQSRMRWIEQAAGHFHWLMLNQNTHMMQELQTIAGWVDSPDAKMVY